MHSKNTNLEGFTPHIAKRFGFSPYTKKLRSQHELHFKRNKLSSRASLCEGFTLIETVIYLALFTLIMGGFLIVIYGIIQSASASTNKTVVEEEGSFGLAKLKWALSGASAITVGANTLSITKPSLPSGQNPLLFDLNSGAMRLRRGSGTSTPLTSMNAKMTNLTFTDIPASNGKPEGVTISFLLTDQAYSETSTLTVYLRK